MQSKLLAAIVLISNLSLAQVNKIIVGPGPEDFVLDTTQNQKRLIISCDERRDNDSVIEGGIWGYDLSTKKSYFFKRIEPNSHSFNPHGIYLLIEDDVKYLFVVNHFDTYKKNEIIRYQIKQDSLIFEARYPYNSTINSVCAVSKEHFYITNDRLFKGKLVMYKDGVYTTLDRSIAFPNGVNIKDNYLYLSTTVSGKVLRYPIQSDGFLGKKEKIATVKGADNIRFYRNKLLTTSHPKFKKFLQHMKDSNKQSPTVVHEIDLTTFENKIIFEDGGDIINAGSGAVLYGDKLYVAQVFEDFILEIKLSK